MPEKSTATSFQISEAYGSRVLTSSTPSPAGWIRGATGPANSDGARSSPSLATAIHGQSSPAGPGPEIREGSKTCWMEEQRSEAPRLAAGKGLQSF